MDWISTMQIIFGGGVVAGIVEVCAAIRHRKADKVKAEAEAVQASATAKTSDIEAQRQEIDLMKYMRETMAEWMTHTEDGNKKNLANQEKMLQRLERIDERTENVELSLADVVKYLNGDYQQWLANNKKPTNRYGKN